MAKKKIPQFATTYSNPEEALAAALNPNIQKKGIANIGSQAASTFRGFDTGIGQSKYDKDISWNADIDEEDIQGSIQEYRAQNQSWGAKASAGIARAGVKAAFEVAKLAPTVAGIVSAPFAKEGEGWETAFNNTGHQFLNNLNEHINDEALPVYVKKSVQNGDLWANLSSIDFWATEGADGVGFMAAMFAPGAVLKALGGANKFKSILGGFEKGREWMQSAANLGLKADEVGITMANTIAEAGSEAGSQMQAMNDSKADYIKSYIAKGNTPEQAEQMFNEQKSRLGRDAFMLNMALLSGTNFANTKMLGLAGESSVKKAGNFALRDAEGKIVDKIANRTLKDRLVSAPLHFGEMLLNEGFIEEGMQSTFENALKHRAEKGELSDSGLGDISSTPFANEYMDMLSSTDGQKAIMLGGILGYGAKAISSTRGIISGKGTEKDNEIKRVNSLLQKGREASNIFFAKVNPDIYKRTEEKDPETGEYKYEIKNGKKVIDPVKQEQFLLNAQITKEQSEEWDKASQEGDISKLNQLQNIAEARLIESFISDSEDGLNILSEHLKDLNLPEQRKSNILKKAETVQKSHEQFIAYGEPVLNLKHKNASQEDVKTYYNMLAHTNMMNTLNKLTVEDNLKQAKEQVDELLKQHGITRDNTEENNRMISQLSQKDMRFTKPLALENIYQKQLDDINENNLDIWDPKKQKDSFNEFIDYKTKVNNKYSEENVKAAEEVADNIANATTTKEVDEAINGKTKTETAEDIEKNIPTVTETLRKPTDTVDSETAEVLKQTAQKKTEEIAVKNNTEASQIAKEIEEEINYGDKFNDEYLEEVDGGGYLNNATYDYYDSLDEYEREKAKYAKSISKPVDELPVDDNINSKDLEDNTDSKPEPIQEDIDVSTQVDILSTASPDIDDTTNLYPNVATMGVDRSGPTSGNFSKWVSESFKNFINNFKSVVDTPVTFSLPNYLSEDNKKAIEILNNKTFIGNEQNLDFLYRNYPIQVNIDSNTFTFIPSFHLSLNDNTTFQGRKNIVSAIIKNGGIEGLQSTIKYQKGGKLVYDKTTDGNGNIITENKIGSLKEFQDDVTKAPLYFVKDETGNLYDEKGNLIDGLDQFPSVLKNAHNQKGYVYTIIHSPGGIEVPVKLNIRKINNNQAEMIYQVYKSLHDYNQKVPSNEKLTQYVAKLNDLYKLNPQLKSVIESNFQKELSIFKNKNEITVGDFMTLFIHDNVTIEGETKPYTTKYVAGQILAGQGGLLNFNESSPMSKDDFINFLITNKRQNTKISYLAGENNNVNANEYKKYLLEDITNVNIDTQQPFKGDINIYIDSKIEIPEKLVVKTEIKVENNQENIRNSENKDVSSLPDKNTTSYVDMSQINNTKKKRRGLDNLPPTKC